MDDLGIVNRYPVAVINRKEPSPARSEAEPAGQKVRELEVREENEHARIRFSRSDGSGDMVISIIDPQTSEVIRQIPSERALSVLADLDPKELRSGFVNREG